MEYIIGAATWHKKNPNWFPLFSSAEIGEKYSGSGVRPTAKQRQNTKESDLTIYGARIRRTTTTTRPKTVLP